MRIKSASSKSLSGKGASLFKLIVALVLSGLLIGSFRLVSWPRPSWLTFILLVLPASEILILLGAGIVGRNLRNRRLISIPVSLGFGILVVWNVGELIYRWNYRDHFSLFDDLALLPSLLTMITRISWFRTPMGNILIYFVAVLLLLLLGSIIYRLVRGAAWSIDNLVSAGTSKKTILTRIGFLILALGIIEALLLPKETPVILLTGSILGRNAIMVTEAPVAPALPVLTDEQILEAKEAFEKTEQSHAWSYPGIEDADIHLLVVESYGHTLFTNETHRGNIAPIYEEIASTLDAAGWSSASGFLHSPAYGGRSWLADATLITGTRMTNQRIFDQHIYTENPNLSGQMGAAGYHTVYAAPGTRRTPDDWKDYYGYDEYLIEGGMGWEGPFISFGNMSDQYFLDFLGRRYTGKSDPLFVTALMVSSHVPFVRIPEYFPDWDRLGDGTIYNTEGIRRFNNNWLTGSEYPEGYVYSIEYALKVILGYLDNYVDEDALVIIVGDHQPRTPISENTATSGVPIHFLSRTPEVLEPLYSEGLSEGFVPGDGTPLSPMEDFPHLLNLVLKPQGVLSRYMP